MSVRRASLLRHWATLLAFAMTALGWGNQAVAWDAAGHRVVAGIAMANVRPQTAARLRALLQAQADVHTPGCAIGTLDDAATWPDCLRSDPVHWKFTYAWHYQDEAICGHFDIDANCPGGACVSAQIVRMRRILADRHQGHAQRLVALAFLVHFVGDIHQPLHVADHDDHGGNGVIVSHSPLPLIGDPNRPESLHWFWDTLPEAVLADAAHPLVRVYAPAERARLAGGDVADWARESYDLARTMAYPRAFHHDPCAGSSPQAIDISAADVRSYLPVARQRLAQAGLRLARVLDAALAS